MMIVHVTAPGDRVRVLDLQTYHQAEGKITTLRINTGEQHAPSSGAIVITLHSEDIRILADVLASYVAQLAEGIVSPSITFRTDH